MKVKEIMRAAAELAGRRDLSDYLAGAGGTDTAALQRDAAQMLRCFNLTENEAALDFVPLVREETFLSDGKILFSAFSGRPVEVLAVRGENGRKLHFRADADGIFVRKGETTVRYRFRPDVKSEGDETDFGCGERFLALGAACEFSLMEGALDRAAELDARYKDALAAAGRQKNGDIRPRRWI